MKKIYAETLINTVKTVAKQINNIKLQIEENSGVDSELMLSDDLFALKILIQNNEDMLFDDILITLEYLPKSIEEELFTVSSSLESAEEASESIRILLHNVFNHDIELYEKRYILGMRNYFYVVGKDSIEKNSFRKKSLIHKLVRLFPR